MTLELEQRKQAAGDIPKRELRRSTAAFETRTTGDTVTLEGYATTFDSPYDMGWYQETVRAGAFDKTLREADNIFLMGIHEGWPLAGTAVDTLALAPDSTGLHIRGTMPLSQDVQRMVDSITNAGVDKMSMGFQTLQQAWSPDYEQRDLLELRLFEVSVVPIPANPGTSVGLRNRALRKLAPLVAELRAGKTLSAANVDRLMTVLGQLANADAALDPLRAVIDGADDALDAAQAGIAEILGVPNPDPAEPSETDDPETLAFLALERELFEFHTR